jgi:hypothetical protein
LLRGGQILAVVVAEVIVRHDAADLDSSTDEVVNEHLENVTPTCKTFKQTAYALDLGLSGFEVIAGNLAQGEEASRKQLHARARFESIWWCMLLKPERRGAGPAQQPPVRGCSEATR